MATYRQIHVKIWTSPDFQQLTANAKLVFIYLFSNSHRNEAALYRITFKTIAIETDLTMEEVDKAINECEELGLVKYDRQHYMVWVVNAVKYQKISPNEVKAIAKNLLSINHDYVNEFLSYYKEITPTLEGTIKDLLSTSEGTPGKGKGKDNGNSKDSATKKTLVNTDTDTPTQKINNMPASGDAGESEPLGSNGLTSHEDGKRVQNEHCSGAVSKKKGTHDYTPEFEEFWSVYPKKVEKLAAFQQWKARIRQGYEPEDLITAAKNYALAVQGKEPDFIKYPKTFLGKTLPFKEFMPGAGPPEQRTMTAPTRQLTDTEEYMRQLEIEVFGHELPG